MTRRRLRRKGWGVEGLADLTTPLAQRRLRITSALLTALERRRREVASGPEGLADAKLDKAALNDLLSKKW